MFCFTQNVSRHQCVLESCFGIQVSFIVGSGNTLLMTGKLSDEILRPMGRGVEDLEDVVSKPRLESMATHPRVTSLVVELILWGLGAALDNPQAVRVDGDRGSDSLSGRSASNVLSSLGGLGKGGPDRRPDAVGGEVITVAIEIHGPSSSREFWDNMARA